MQTESPKSISQQFKSGFKNLQGTKRPRNVPLLFTPESLGPRFKKAKIVRPRQAGRGMTGIYFDSLWTAGSGTDKFQINGTDLHPDNERRLLQAFETLKFKK